MKPPDPNENGGPVSKATAHMITTSPKEVDALGESVNDLEVITLDESSDFIRLEKVIKHGLDTFVEVGNALAEILARRLYRCEYKTFDAYCREKWNIGRTYAHRIMAAAETVEMLPMGNKPTSERQARPLTKIPAEKRAEAWQRAVERADGGQPTAADVEAVVQEVVVAPATVTPRVVIDAAERIWAVAKGHLDKIIDQDASLVRVMDKVIAYGESRKAELSARKVKLSGRQSRRLTFTFDGRLINAVPWNHGDHWQSNAISITAHSKAEIVRTLKRISPTTIGNSVWQASSNEEA